MRKEEKLEIINAISAQLEETPNFYIVDIAGLNAGKTHELRKACFEAGVQLVVSKNTLFTKVLEATENEEMMKLTEVLAGPTAIMYTVAPNAPAKVIKKFHEKSTRSLSSRAHSYRIGRHSSAQTSLITSSLSSHVRK